MAIAITTSAISQRALCGLFAFITFQTGTEPNERTSLQFIDTASGRLIENVRLGVVDDDGATTLGHFESPIDLVSLGLESGDSVHVYAAGYELEVLDAERLAPGQPIRLTPWEGEPTTIRFDGEGLNEGVSVRIRGGIVSESLHWQKADPSMRFRSPIAIEYEWSASEFPLIIDVPDGLELRINFFSEDAYFAPEFVRLRAGESCDVQAIRLRDVSLVTGSGATLTDSFLLPDCGLDHRFGEKATGAFMRAMAAPSMGSWSEFGWQALPPFSIHAAFRLGSSLAYCRLPEGDQSIQVDAESFERPEILAWRPDIADAEAILLPGHLDASAAIELTRYYTDRYPQITEYQRLTEVIGRLPWAMLRREFTAVQRDGRIGHGMVDESGTASVDWQRGRIDVSAPKGATVRCSVALESRWAPFDDVRLVTAERRYWGSVGPGEVQTFGGLPNGCYLVLIEGESIAPDGTRRRIDERRWVTLDDDQQQASVSW